MTRNTPPPRDGSTFWGYSKEQGWNEMFSVYDGHFFALKTSPHIRCFDPVKWRKTKPEKVSS